MGSESTISPNYFLVYPRTRTLQQKSGQGTAAQAVFRGFLGMNVGFFGGTRAEDRNIGQWVNLNERGGWHSLESTSTWPCYSRDSLLTLRASMPPFRLNGKNCLALGKPSGGGKGSEATDTRILRHETVARPARRPLQIALESSWPCNSLRLVGDILLPSGVQGFADCYDANFVVKYFVLGGQISINSFATRGKNLISM